MMIKTEGRSRISFIIFTQNTRFMNVISRLDDPNIMREIMVKLGYSFIGPEVGPGSTYRGKIATREDLEVSYNPDRQVIGITGKNPNKVLGAFNDLLATIHRDENNALQVFFHETILIATAEGSKNPLETFAYDNNGFGISTKLKKIFGGDVSPYGIRLSPSKKTVDATDWFEFRIEPHIYRPDKTYSIVYVFRSKDLKKLIEANTKLEEKIKSIIMELEGNSAASAK